MTTTQMDIFSSSSLERLKIDKPIRLIELFAGYGSQSLALKYLNADYESYRICEWNYKSFEAYRLLHFPDNHTDYSKDMSIQQLREWVEEKGVSADWNKPMPKTTISHLSENNLREIYNSAMATHNLVDISRVSSSNLGIERERERQFTYLMTYSFPCQDLSLAGKCKGMEEGSGTRSSLLWQVERILGDLRKESQRPDILLMENVPQVHGKRNEQNFNKWLNDLHDLGYTSYFDDLEATGFDIPQTRNRCFVVSVLGEKTYEFPKPHKLTKVLKDMLEDKVDRKYYLTQRQVDAISKWNAFQKPLEKLDKDRISGTLTTCSLPKLVSFNAAVRGREDGTQHLEIGGEEKSNTIETVEKDHLVATNNPLCISSTQAHSFAKANGTFIPIRDCTKKGYDEAKDGDGVYISNIKGKRGTVQHGKIQTLKTSPDVGVVLYNGQYMFIRKFTPRECFRLMGVRDDDFGRLCGNFSDSILYHLAGDSIVVDVLMAIFRNMF
jgi:DNA (cytosine-5)-methyltransferase 1